MTCGSLKNKEPPEIRGRGLWLNPQKQHCGSSIKDTFEEGCLLAVNMGEDANTTGAIYGQQRHTREKWNTSKQI